MDRLFQSPLELQKALEVAAVASVAVARTQTRPMPLQQPRVLPVQAARRRQQQVHPSSCLQTDHWMLEWLQHHQSHPIPRP